MFIILRIISTTDFLFGIIDLLNGYITTCIYTISLFAIQDAGNASLQVILNTHSPALRDRYKITFFFFAYFSTTNRHHFSKYYYELRSAKTILRTGKSKQRSSSSGYVKISALSVIEYFPIFKKFPFLLKTEHIRGCTKSKMQNNCFMASMFCQIYR